MGCCNSKKLEQSELNLQTMEEQPLNNDGGDDLVLAGAAIQLSDVKPEVRPVPALSLSDDAKREDAAAGDPSLPINTPTFGQLGKKPGHFAFEGKHAELREVEEEQTFGGGEASLA